jgi:hypothetical protein
MRGRFSSVRRRRSGGGAGIHPRVEVQDAAAGHAMDRRQRPASHTPSPPPCSTPACAPGGEVEEEGRDAAGAELGGRSGARRRIRPRREEGSAVRGRKGGRERGEGGGAPCPCSARRRAGDGGVAAGAGARGERKEGEDGWGAGDRESRREEKK